MRLTQYGLHNDGLLNCLSFCSSMGFSTHTFLCPPDLTPIEFSGCQFRCFFKQSFVSQAASEGMRGCFIFGHFFNSLQFRSVMECKEVILDAGIYQRQSGVCIDTSGRQIQ